jgi:hypothetical protein
LTSRSSPRTRRPESVTVATAASPRTPPTSPTPWPAPACRCRWWPTDSRAIPSGSPTVRCRYTARSTSVPERSRPRHRPRWRPGPMSCTSNGSCSCTAGRGRCPACSLRSPRCAAPAPLARSSPRCTR